MKKIIIAAVLLVGGSAYFWFGRTAAPSGSPGQVEQRPGGPGQGGGAPGGPPGAGGAAGGRRPGGGGGFGGFGGGPAGPMAVEVATVTRGVVTEQLTVVGNLIGEATVEVVSRVAGRLESVAVRLGDPVRKGQVIAKVEDAEVRQQVAQAEAAFEVSQATVRQREADLTFAETNATRSRNLFQRQLLPQQTLDDAEARLQASQAQLDLSRAQFNQTRARLEELRITLGNTQILSPVDGFVGRRNLDVGGFLSGNTAVFSVVDISSVRLVVNLVERDLRRVSAGTPAETEVDAYPGEIFKGRVARVAPVLDPATRTAEIEVEIPNPNARLKPGMYARARLTVGERAQALVVPRNAVVAVGGQRGVYVLNGESNQVTFQKLTTGLEDQARTEVLEGIRDGQIVVTTGANALRDGDTVRLPGQAPNGGAGGGPGGRRRGPGGAPPEGTGAPAGGGGAAVGGPAGEAPQVQPKSPAPGSAPGGETVDTPGEPGRRPGGRPGGQGDGQGGSRGDGSGRPRSPQTP